MWKKTKIALGLNLCVLEPRTRDDEDSSRLSTERILDASSVSAASSMATNGCRSDSDYILLEPIAPIPTSSCLQMSKSGIRSYKKTCAICLETMKAGHGALFTGECSHAFHFNCIASNVKHGNSVCPICRSKWKEIPFLGPSGSDLPRIRARVSYLPPDNGTMSFLRRVPHTDVSNRQHHLASLLNSSEPNIFDDDEPIWIQVEPLEHRSTRTIDIKAYPEYPAVPKMATEDSFSILIHLKAPSASERSNLCLNQSVSSTALQPSRAPIDLVTVLDISGSMAGTKLALLKRAMGFVIQNLGPSDRLSVVAFSSAARRLFPLRRMTDSGRQHALQAVNSLVSSGGTNIAEGLRKGAKVIEERKEKNPVCSIILLSDGQDTYTVSMINNGVSRTPVNYESLLPSSIRGNAGHRIPVHAFGFGTDHDSFSMHSISETSGGTFSFIESEGVIQDAFAQCIGGLLSVLVQEMSIEVECLHPDVYLAPIRSGSYESQVEDGKRGSINVGDLYADEERDFIVSVNIPPVSTEETILLKVGCSYIDPLSKEVVSLSSKEVIVQRPEAVSERAMSIEVDRERNRISAAEAIADARAAAERDALSEAVSILEACRAVISESLAGRSGDQLCAALDSELKEMQYRMESRQRYEESGRAYLLSGLSSHSWQRATARGNSTDSASLLHSYQTPAMADMLHRSQTLSTTPRHLRPAIVPARSFPTRPGPR